MEKTMSSVEYMNKINEVICDEKIYVSYLDNETTLSYIEGGNLGFAQKGREDKFDRKVGILISVARSLGFEEEMVQDIIDVIFDDRKRIAKKLDIFTLTRVIDEIAVEQLKNRL